MEFIGRLSWIVISDLFDLLELFHQARLADIDSDLMHQTIKQRDKCQCENAVERMYTKHLVCPMAWRGEADKVGIFHVPEGSLDVVLPAVAKYNLSVGKILAVSEQNPLAKDTLLQLIVGFVVGSKFNPKPPILARWNLISSSISFSNRSQPIKARNHRGIHGIVSSLFLECGGVTPLLLLKRRHDAALQDFFVTRAAKRSSDRRLWRCVPERSRPAEPPQPIRKRLPHR